MNRKRIFKIKKAYWNFSLKDYESFLTSHFLVAFNHCQLYNFHIYIYIYISLWTTDICWPKQILFWPCFWATHTHSHTHTYEISTMSWVRKWFWFFGNCTINAIILKQNGCHTQNNNNNKNRNRNNIFNVWYDLNKIFATRQHIFCVQSTIPTPKKKHTHNPPFWISSRENKMIWNRFVVFTSCKSF